jgi:hypothetical protein
MALVGLWTIGPFWPFLQKFINLNDRLTQAIFNSLCWHFGLLGFLAFLAFFAFLAFLAFST